MKTSNLPFLGFALLTLISTNMAHADHPQILTTSDQKSAIASKLQTADWAQTALAALKARIDPLVAKAQTDPQFVTSRMPMHWQTHFTTTLVEKSRTVGGEGHAPVPTPRFEGERNWASDYSMPANLEDWKPFNDQNGKIYLLNKKTNQMEWADPGDTGAAIRSATQRIMGLAADAAFMYWLSGDEKYARFSSDILWTYMEGFSYTTAPKLVTPDKGMADIIGPTTFEVIHENAVISIALAYDFLGSYLEKQGRDTKVIQSGLKRWADRVIDGGSREGNWNLNQAMMIAYAGLALEPNAAYADEKGREYYANVVLNADLPHQKGLTQVIKEGFDPESALWPEAAGYGFGSSGQIIELASLLQNDPAGMALLKSPFLVRGLVNQGELLYPNGLSEGVGDTTNTRLNTAALENLLSVAQARSDVQTEQMLASYLQREIASGNYDRSSRSDVYALVRFVSTLPTTTSAPAASRSFFFPGLNISMQRNLASGGDPMHSLAAAMYGTKGGHIHQNGLAIELYGAGYIQGADPGRGDSYWTANHREYYVSPVAHNTVVVNGTSTYDEYKDPNRAMKLEASEPASQQAPLSPNISFAQGSFTYTKPAATQDRNLALVRTGPTSGFYFDVFRSKAADATGEFNDYFYHNMGTLNEVSTPLAPSSVLASQTGILKGYTYFKNERSATVTSDLKATFSLDLPGKPGMNLWMPNTGRRTVFAVDAPPNNTIREAIAANVRTLPMPTLVVRQNGEAWNRPFVSVYEPFLAGENTVHAVRSIAPTGIEGLVATVVEGQGYRVSLFQDAAPTKARIVEKTRFTGSFGAIIERDGKVDEMYLGGGTQLSCDGLSLRSADGKPLQADLRRDGQGWVYSSDREVIVAVGNKTRKLPPAMNAKL